MDYDPDTGVFRWKTQRGSRVKARSVAGYLRKDGYLGISIHYQTYYLHRLAWLYVYGYFPETQIDHINRLKSDNRLSNLREISSSCNAINTGDRSNNTSGIKGVCWNKTKNKWQASIKTKSKGLYLGIYSEKKDAVKARWTAEKEHNFPNCCSDSSAYLYLKEHNII